LINVRACDDNWDTVPSVTNLIEILSSDVSATLPMPALLVSGTGTFSVTLNAGGTFNFFAHDLTDLTIPDGVSTYVEALVLSGFEFSRINQKNQNAGVPMTITLTAKDPNGGTVTGYSGSVRLKELTSFGEGRISPDIITLNQGIWNGPVTMYRADETNINRGNVNIYAFIEAAPSKNGTSDPFVVHPGAFARVQIVLPGETPLPGGLIGREGTPASQAAGQDFSVQIYATDDYWNPLPSDDTVRITSSDPGASTPVSGPLVNGHQEFNLSFGTVGTQTLTVSDQTNGSITGMTSPPVDVLPSSAAQFVIEPVTGPVTAGQPIVISIRATDDQENTIPDFNGDAILSANTGPGSMSPALITFQNGLWSGNAVFRGAGGAVAFTCSDFSSPPHTGTSNSFQVTPGPFVGLQVLLPGETPMGGSPSGQGGSPTAHSAGSMFNLEVLAVDQFWNRVSGIGDRIALGSTDEFAEFPADPVLANGIASIPIRLFKSGSQRVWASDLDSAQVSPDTSSAVDIMAGPHARILILAPGESAAPGTEFGRTGTPVDQSINYAFTVEALATDEWWNPIPGVSDVVHLTATDPLATLPADTPLIDGRAELSVRFATGGFHQLTISDVTRPVISGSMTEILAISSGFHLEATVDPTTTRAGETFTLTVQVKNDGGAVIREINSFVTIEVQNASTRDAGRGTLLTSRFQLINGERSVAETYTFAEQIILIASDELGNDPAVTEVLTVLPGVPTTVRLTSDPIWVGGNKHATLTARVVDDYENGVPDQPISFQLITGTGSITSADTLTSDEGAAIADYLSARVPELARIRAQSNALSGELVLETALVDPNASGGAVTNYPNPFHPGVQPTTIAYKLDDAATVTLLLYSLSGELVLRETFQPGMPGGMPGLNEYIWNGENGNGAMVASGGYILQIEATGGGETLHLMRRKIAVVQ
jgi:hypothetical protein